MKISFSERLCIFLSELCFKLPLPRPGIVKSSHDICEEEFTTVKDLEKANLRNKAVLDLGCGAGGQTVYFALHQAVFAVGMDIDKSDLPEGVACAKKNKVIERVDFLVGDALHLPFRENTFDIVVMNHAIEHIPSVPETLNQCKQVVKHNGLIYAAFPSWLYPYAAHLWHVIPIPWCHFLFSEKTLKNVASLAPTTRDHNIPHTLWVFRTLSKITIRKFRKIVENLKFEIVSYKEKPPSRFLSILQFSPLFVKEFFMSNAIYVLRKT